MLVDWATAIPNLYADPTDAALDAYGVTLIYIGAVERHGIPDPQSKTGRVATTSTCAPGPFPNVDDAAFPGPNWEQVFDEDGVQIFRRRSG